MPYSKALIVILAGINIVVKYMTEMVGIRVVNNLSTAEHPIKVIGFGLLEWCLIIVATYAILLTLLFGCLTIYQKKNRFVQLVISVLVVDIMLTVVLLLGMLIIHYFPYLGIVFLGILVWEFILYMHVFANGFSVRRLAACGCSFFYMIMQHNIGEMVMRYLQGKGA